MVLHGTLVLILGGAGGLGLWLAAQAGAGLTFLLFLVPAVLALFLAPPLIYRLFALQRAAYILRRDGILLYWGLRKEEIPIDTVQWVGLPARLSGKLPHIVSGWPGAVVGVRKLADGKPSTRSIRSAGLIWKRPKRSRRGVSGGMESRFGRASA